MKALINLAVLLVYADSLCKKNGYPKTGTDQTDDYYIGFALETLAASKSMTARDISDMIDVVRILVGQLYVCEGQLSAEQVRKEESWVALHETRNLTLPKYGKVAFELN